MYNIIQNLGHCFDIIALSETWNELGSKKTKSIPELQGYNKFLQTHGNSLKGGCGFYVKSGVKVVERKDLDISLKDDTNEYETKWIEIINKKAKNLLLCVCYRHPRKTSNDSFIKYMKDTLQKVEKKNLYTIITGDFNYDLLNIDRYAPACEFLETLMSKNFQPCILEPTRIVFGHRPSLVDNFFINTIDKKVTAGNLLSKISDHLPSFLILNNVYDKLNKKGRQTKDYSNFDESLYKADLRKININSIKNSLNNPTPDIDSIFCEFNKQLTDVINKHVPTKYLSIKEVNWKRKPWINMNLQKIINNKNKIYAKYARTKSTFWYEKYKVINKQVRSLLFSAKKDYYNNYFTSHMNNLCKIWSGINELTHVKKQNHYEEIFLNTIGGITTDQKNVANNFNRYFTNVADELVLKLGKPNTKFQDYLKNPNEHSIYLNEIEPDEVRKLFHDLDIKKSGDIYGVTPYLIKLGSDELYELLTFLFNKTLGEGKFPSVLKSAVVIPIHKADSKMITSNYRPISLLPILGKCLEKLIYRRLYKFIQDQDILCHNQYGFQKNKSTEQAVFDLQAKVVNALEKGESPCCVFLDLAKAFDTVNKDILMHKLNYYGIRGSTHSLINSYLAGRTQCVQINDIKSEKLPVNAGVPQGSILGPLLFLIYINDAVNASEKLKFTLFADDTCLFLSHKDVNVIQSTLDTELPKVNDWLVANKLSLNTKKTKAMVFRHKNKSPKPLVKIMLNGIHIEEVSSMKYLGIILDHKLTFKEHTDHIKNKIIKANRLLARICHFVKEKELKSFYYAHIHSHIVYGSIIWGGAAPSYLNNIQRLQEKSFRLMTFSKSAIIDPMLKQIDILSVKKTLSLARSCFVWKIAHGFLGTPIIETFEENVFRKPNFQSSFKYIQPHSQTWVGCNFIINQGRL